MIIENGSCSVYVHTNKLNGKMYVGMTKRPVQERWGENGSKYKECRRFYNAIQKYGWDNFEHDIIASNLTEEEAMHMEELLIDKLNLQDDQFGYNIKCGGTNCSLQEETKALIGNKLRGRTYSDEKKALYSAAHKGKSLSSEHVNAIKRSRSKIVRTEEWNENIRKSWQKYCGENHPNYGKKLTEEHKQKMVLGSKKLRKEHPELWYGNRKAVLCIETNTVYESIDEASKSLQISHSSISACAAGKRKSAGKLHWKFAEKPRD